MIIVVLLLLLMLLLLLLLLLIIIIIIIKCPIETMQFIGIVPVAGMFPVYSVREIYPPPQKKKNNGFCRRV